mmetsp:Transcript_21856/g.49272  ORF Transcript_21856/g.49272 Transcript_21856/m.49272 type:complete len:141 (-) Transcript_21856:289-711(-)
MCGEDADDKGGERQKNRGAARKTGKDLRAIMVEFAQILCNLRSKLPQGEERDRFDENHSALLQKKVAVQDFIRYAGGLIIVHAPGLAHRWPAAVRSVQLISGASPPSSPPVQPSPPNGRPWARAPAMNKSPSLNSIMEEV